MSLSIIIGVLIIIIGLFLLIRATKKVARLILIVGAILLSYGLIDIAIIEKTGKTIWTLIQQLG